MSAPALSRDDRAALLAKHREARMHYNHSLEEHVRSLGDPAEIGVEPFHDNYVDSPEHRRAREALSEMGSLEDDYFRRIPRLVLAACPHCEKPLHRTFDPLGLDGLWWRSDASPEEPPACAHFCVLLGAVDVGDHRPKPDFEVHPGPGAPFVMPRLLAHPGMTAVVAAIPLVEGAVAYPVAYFAPRRPPVQTLTASWARTNFVYTTQLGEHGWRRADEPAGAPGDDTWDIDLSRWLATGQLRWCDPGGDRTTLSTAPVATCPFVGLPGTHAPQIIRAAG